MRTWLFNTLTQSVALQSLLSYDLATMKTHVIPRRSEGNFNLTKPFIVLGIGNATNEDLAEDQDHVAYRQFIQIWVHDEGGSYVRIDSILAEIKKLLVGQSDAATNLTNLVWLETSQEFSNETYNTIFRYHRFQGIISKGAAP